MGEQFKRCFGARSTMNRDERYTPPESVELILPYIPADAKVWCPFDTEESWYYRKFKDRGNEVVATHIWNGQDFFETDMECDYIVSNPPFSKKTEILKRLFELDKPFAMLLGMDGLFDGVKRFDLFAENEFELLIPEGRVRYGWELGCTDLKPGVPPFKSIYVCHKVLPKQIMFCERIGGRRGRKSVNE